MNRRTAILMVGCTLLPGLARAQDAATAVPAHPLLPSWQAWKTEFLEADGRVVDSLQMGASHLESQGYGLLLSASLSDAEDFDLIDGWTMEHLAIRPDSLFAWRWLPADPAGVPDLNNASDGDLFYAWALIRAAQTLGQPALVERASVIARDLAAVCILPHPDGGGRLLFAPAAAGFQRGDGLIVNPSYYMPLAAQGLIPDWIEVRPDGMVPADGMSDNRGDEALRVLLFAIWSRLDKSPVVANVAAALATGRTLDGQTPTVTDRLSVVVLESRPDKGYAAIAALSACVDAERVGAAKPRFANRQHYYPATLQLMALLAQLETSLDCVPI